MALLGWNPGTEQEIFTKEELIRIFDIRRTMFAHFQDVARAHGEVFGEIRPATTAVAVARLVDPAFLVEIEADATVVAS